MEIEGYITYQFKLIQHALENVNAWGYQQF